MQSTTLQTLKISFYSNYHLNFNQNHLPKMLPLKIQIGSYLRQIQPQYASTQMRLIQELVRCLQPSIPYKQKLYIVNWTKGRQIGRSIDPTQTLQSLLQQSEQPIPTIRIYFKNCPKYHVKIDLHSILILDYTDVNIFHEMIDLQNFVIADVKRAFKLDKKIKFSLKFNGQLKHAHKLAFVGRYLTLNKINHIDLMIIFKQDLTTDYVKQKLPNNYQNLICPISQLIMQDPIITKCKHYFDKLCICMAIMKDNKCPVCRHHLNIIDIKCCKSLKQSIRSLKNQRYMEQQQLKKQEQPENNNII